MSKVSGDKTIRQPMEADNRLVRITVTIKTDGDMRGFGMYQLLARLTTSSLLAYDLNNDPITWTETETDFTLHLQVAARHVKLWRQIGMVVVL